MRGKQTIVNQKIKDLLSEYCQLFDVRYNDVFELCESGSFPWRSIDNELLEGTGMIERIAGKIEFSVFMNISNSHIVTLRMSLKYFIFQGQSLLEMYFYNIPSIMIYGYSHSAILLFCRTFTINFRHFFQR